MVDNRREHATAQGIDDDEFGEEELDAGDEGMFGDAIGTVKGWFGGKKKDDPNAAALQPIVSKMEADGISVKIFLEAIQHQTKGANMKVHEFNY